MRKLNESAIKAHALECSNRFRAGKFTRVGSEFIDEVQADVEAVTRKLQVGDSDEPALGTSLTFVTGAMVEQVQEALNARVAVIIQRKVQAQPSVGCTLGRTR